MMYFRHHLTVLVVVLLSSILGCSLLARWPSAIIATGWSRDNQPVVLEQVWTGYQLVFREGWFTGQPTGKRLIVSLPGGNKHALDIPLEGERDVRILNEASLLFTELHCSGLECQVQGRLYDLAKSQYTVGITVRIPPSLDGLSEGIFSQDLKYFALATKSGIWLYDTAANTATVLYPEFRALYLRFSDDNRKLAAYVAVEDMHLPRVPFPEVFGQSRGTVTIASGTYPQRRVEQHTFHSASVVIDLGTRAIELALPSPKSVPWHFFEEGSSSRTGFYTVRDWPFCFDHAGALQQARQNLGEINDGTMYGPYISPDGNNFGFFPVINQPKRISWQRLNDNTLVYFDIAKGIVVSK